MQLAGKTFIVTGGASGLGEATVRNLAAVGANAVIADIDDQKGAQLATELGSQVYYVSCDVADETSVKAVIGAALSRFNGLNGAVNCAGVAMAMKVISSAGPHSLEVFATVLKINLIGTFNVIRFAAAAIQSQPPDENGERGVIVNTASIAAYEAQIGQVAYAASKGGIVSMTLPAARELARYGIRVMTIAPGVFDTPMMALMPQAGRDALCAQVPFPPRLGRPEEFAALVRHIIENPMLNGETIRLDGAWRMAPK